jgi:hypothetical protein
VKLSTFWLMLRGYASGRPSGTAVDPDVMRNHSVESGSIDMGNGCMMQLRVFGDVIPSGSILPEVINRVDKYECGPDLDNGIILLTDTPIQGVTKKLRGLYRPGLCYVLWRDGLFVSKEEVLGHELDHMLADEWDNGSGHNVEPF